MPDLPRVSIVIPCRNERAYIAACLDSVLGNDYPADRLEIWVVDGMSRDGTRALLEDYGRAHSQLRVLDNPRGVTPAALNIGIRAATGPVVMRMDAHSQYPSDYVRKCVTGLLTYGADNVGGRWVVRPLRPSLVGDAICTALAHPFGVGNAHYRFDTERPREVDTVPYGCYRRDVFERVGGFNEALVRGQDMEFNRRLVHAGGRILLLPGVYCVYHPRTELAAFVRHNWRNGEWAILPFLYSPVVPVRLRHLTPAAFILGLGLAALLTVAHPAAWPALAAIGGTYGSVAVVASVQVAWVKRDIRYGLVLPLVFAAVHIPYGLGSVAGIVRGAYRWVTTRRRRATRERGPQ